VGSGRLALAAPAPEDGDMNPLPYLVPFVIFCGFAYLFVRSNRERTTNAPLRGPRPALQPHSPPSGMCRSFIEGRPARSWRGWK
jgi:hypothetical protein